MDILKLRRWIETADTGAALAAVALLIQRIIEVDGSSTGLDRLRDALLALDDDGVTHDEFIAWCEEQQLD